MGVLDDLADSVQDSKSTSSSSVASGASASAGSISSGSGSSKSSSGVSGASSTGGSIKDATTANSSGSPDDRDAQSSSGTSSSSLSSSTSSTSSTSSSSSGGLDAASGTGGSISGGLNTPAEDAGTAGKGKGKDASSTSVASGASSTAGSVSAGTSGTGKGSSYGADSSTSQTSSIPGIGVSEPKNTSGSPDDRTSQDAINRALALSLLAQRLKLSPSDPTGSNTTWEQFDDMVTELSDPKNAGSGLIIGGPYVPGQRVTGPDGKLYELQSDNTFKLVDSSMPATGAGTGSGYEDNPVYQWLTNTIGPPGQWNPEHKNVWQQIDDMLQVFGPGTTPVPAPDTQLKTNIVTTVPIDPKTGQPVLTSDTLSTDPNWAAFQDMLHQVTRLPAEPVSEVAPAPYTPDPRVQANDVLPSGEMPPTVVAEAPAVPPVITESVAPDEGLTWEPAVAGTPTPDEYGTPPNGDPWQGLRVGDQNPPTVPGVVTGTSDTAQPTAWDNTVDKAGKLLSHTGLGSIVSLLFPDLWNAGGDMMKGLLDGASGTITGPAADAGTTGFRHPSDDTGGNGGGETGGGTDGGSGLPPPADFPDVNGNGIDDRLEPGIQYPPPTWDQYGQAVFPGPYYRPGIDNEWMYFRKQMANGGYVGYADGGPISQPDPRVQVIADAEDALDNMASGTPQKNDAAAIKTFVDKFGSDALRQLQINVAAGAKMRPKSGRMVVGPGGPKDDAIPAVIDGTQPAALSSGEFVLPADAVAGAGNGDPAAGAQALQQLSEILSKRAA